MVQNPHNKDGRPESQNQTHGNHFSFQCTLLAVSIVYCDYADVTEMTAVHIKVVISKYSGPLK